MDCWRSPPDREKRHHIRYFSVSASNTLQSEEYVLPTTWTDTDYQYTVTQDLGAPVSLRLNGTWNRSLAGTSLTSKPIYWHTSAGNYELLSGVTQNPAVSNATGQWLFSGTSLAFSATSDPLSFSASVGTIAFDLIDNNSLHL